MQTPAQDQQPQGGIKGPVVVIAIMGGLVAVVLLVLLGYTVIETEGDPCASGDMATNPLVDGRYQPRTEVFDNVEDAEAFICHDVPELQADGWALERIAAERTLPLEFLVEAEGLGIVSLGYLEDASGRALTLEAAPFFGLSYFESQIPDQHTEEDVRVQGNPGTAYRFGINPDAITVVWIDATLEHRASTTLSPDFQLPDLLALLQTLN